MSTINDGGPAFPVPEVFDERRGEMVQHSSTGMSLRDYFAACRKPAPADISRCWGEAMVRPYPRVNGADAPFGRETILWWADVEAAWSYAQADALLRARANSIPN